MGERRNRKSFWDTEDETKHLSGMREHNSWAGKDHHSSHGSGRHHEFSDSRTTSTRDSRDHSGSGWPSWESIEEHSTAPMSHTFKSTYEGKEMGGGKRYHKNISPGFEEMELHDYNHSHEYERSHSQRYMEKGRSRSRSRSRTQGRSQSRSLSRGRERERIRERERARVRWSRSRSRGDGYGYINDPRRSRSPIGDYRRQSYGWSDKRSGQEKSPQTCRDYASGRCKKGSQCRFYHPNSISRRDGDLVEDDRVECWRSRSDHSQISKQSYTRLGFESRNDVSDLYHGEDEQFLNRSRNSIPCRDFKIGNCRWGDRCRFSHDVASADSFGQDSRNTTFDKNSELKNGKPLCKFFAAGKCNRGNCRFSHEDPNLNNLESRLDKVTESQSSHDKSNWGNASKWDDSIRTSDTPLTGWGEAIATNTTSTGDTTNGPSDGRWSQSSHDKSNRRNAPKCDDAIRTSDTPPLTGWGEAIATNTTKTGDTTNGPSDGRWSLISKNENKIWGIQEWASNSLDRERQPSLPGESGSYSEAMGPAKSIAEDDMPNKQKHLILHDLQLHNNDGVVDLHGLSALQEYQSLTAKALNVPPASHIQQQHFGVIKNNPMSSFVSNVLDEAKDTRYTNHPILLSGQSFNQNGISVFPGHSLDPNERDRGQNKLYINLSNGLDTDLNRPEAHLINPLNVHIHGQSDKRTAQLPGLLEAKVPQVLTNLLTSKHLDQVSNSPVTKAGQHVSPLTNPVSPTQSIVNERSQTYAGVDVSNSRGMLPSITGCLPLVNATNVQDSVRVVSLECNSVGNGRENTDPRIRNLAQGTDQKIQIQLRKSSPSSKVGTGAESSKLEHPEILRQQVEVANLGVTGGSKATGKESKGVQGNRPSDHLDGQGKLEEGSANKDEKGMRLFKNSLIELVKEILKPTWKEGHMSKDVHKTVVKKVVDKVSSTIQVDHIPKTQDKVNLYLSSSKLKITKLIQAYVERSRKPDA